MYQYDHSVTYIESGLTQCDVIFVFLSLCRYLVFVSKHHEGYSNYPSKYSFSWNSMDVGPQRDIVGKVKVQNSVIKI